MATNAAGSVDDDDIDSRIATLERKRPNDVISRDDASSPGSAHSTPRKRAKHAGELGHQDVRDFVPVGASFSTSAVPVEDAPNSSDDGSQANRNPYSEALSDQSALISSSEDMEVHQGNGSGQIDKVTAEDSIHSEISENTSPQVVHTTPSVNRNAVNTTKIRTTLRGSIGKVKNLVEEPSLTNEGHKAAEVHSNRDIGELILLPV